ncbi:hypothetical protein B9Z55_011372 [Caenorhabditis nigoni]|uniref:Uncharacterized protein n=1 Tax=Caenorhabditis nigoni TaxID=1611254 RepID=A0A2G5UJS2_9PELO|nr:hypothetical protein B9Z55_011372 [Caenorhabditis nigoni]
MGTDIFEVKGKRASTDNWSYRSVWQMNFYTIFALFAILAVASVSGHRCRGSSYGGGGRGGRGGAIVIGSNNPNKS